MPKDIKHFFLRKREAKRFLREISQSLGIDAEKIFGSKPQIEIVETKRKKVYLIDRTPLFVVFEDVPLPTLFLKEYLSHLPQVTVDMGAVPYVCNGADVMAPGIVRVDGDFKKGELVVVVDERNKQPIAIAQSIFDSEKIRIMKKGKVLRNLHYVGDVVWNLMKKGSS